MKLTEQQVLSFIEEVESSSPAPGGGSVSALASSLGVALSSMVGKLSITKKKFKALDDDIQSRFHHIMEELTEINFELKELIDKDTEAFNLIMDAFKLPKETETEKKYRSSKIEEGTLEAIKVPFRVAQLSINALRQLDYVLAYGNKNTISDLGVSALMIAAGLEGAILNVKINLPGVSDTSVIEYYQKESNDMLEESSKIRETILQKVHQKL